MKGSLKRFVDEMHSISEFKRNVFVLSVKVKSGPMRPLSWTGDF